jgi:hypothetical protein
LAAAAALAVTKRGRKQIVNFSTEGLVSYSLIKNRVATNLAKINSLTFLGIPVNFFAYFLDYPRQCKTMIFEIEAFITLCT